MTYKDRMVLDVLLSRRAGVKFLLEHEDNDFLFANLQGACDAFDLAIALLRCPLGLLIKEYNRIENGNTK